MTIKSIASAAGVTLPAVYARLKKLGITLKRNGPNPGDVPYNVAQKILAAFRKTAGRRKKSA